MPPRRAAAVVAATKVLEPPSDIELESEDENGSEEDELDSAMDIDDPESEDQDQPDEQDEDQEVDIESADEPTPDVQETAESSRAASPYASGSSLPKQPTRKLRLKLGNNPKARVAASTLNSSAASATPEPDIIPGRRTGKRAIVYDDEDDEDELEDTQSVQSLSRMTARQAALASGLEAEHVQLPTVRKKKVLTQAEIAARRSESALKRKVLTDKKLEDNKTETINRLLKKQSAGTRRKKALEEAAQQQADTSSTGGSTPSGQNQNASGRPSVPSFRWISTSRPRPIVEVVSAGGGEEKVEGMENPPSVSFSFSIPPEFLPPVPATTTAPATSSVPSPHGSSPAPVQMPVEGVSSM